MTLHKINMEEVIQAGKLRRTDQQILAEAGELDELGEMCRLARVAVYAQFDAARDRIQYWDLSPELNRAIHNRLLHTGTILTANQVRERLGLTIIEGE